MKAAGGLTSVQPKMMMDGAALKLSSSVLPAEARVKPRFCQAGCVRCAPVSFALRSDGSASSCQRSECSSSLGNSMVSGSSSMSLKGTKTKKNRGGGGGGGMGFEMPMAILMEERGASSHDRSTSDTRVLENFRDVIPILGFPNGLSSHSVATPDFTSVEEVDLDSEDSKPPALGEEDKLWLRMREEARRDSVKEPALASYLYSSILSHRSLERALAFHLGNKLSSSTLLSTQLFSLIIDTFMEDEEIRRAIRKDIKAVKERDPACVSYSHCLLNFKGFLSCQAHRVAHRLWNQGRHSLALAIQSRVSEVFHVDIHPAARIGSGILFDHATGLVVGETATIGNNVSILHHVTLGGTGAVGGDRHPKIGDGVLIGAGATILGNITIGAGAKIGAGSIVLIDVPPQTTAVGNPARLVGGKQKPSKLKDIPGETMDHTSFIKEWSDYVI